MSIDDATNEEWNRAQARFGVKQAIQTLLRWVEPGPHPPGEMREGLRDTPERVLKAWEQQWAAGYSVDTDALLKCFEDGSEGVDEMVVVKDIPVYSHCEHHLAPFFGRAHVAYLPKGRIVGLSKINRVVDAFARRLQVQERLTGQVADAIEQNLEPLGVAVMLECRHLCMESRGVRQQGHSTVTSAMRGLYRDDAQVRNEFLSIVNGGSNYV